jgi:hypothetical protein
MKTYDYLENVKEDVRNYIEENKIVVTSSNREEVEQELNDTLFVNDSVTGNASGSYTFSTRQAESKKAIQALEELTGDVWVNPYKESEERHRFVLSDEEREEMEGKILSGYYTESAIQERKEAERIAKIEKRKNEVIKTFEKRINKATKEKDVKLAILGAGLLSDNYIYYVEGNNVVFNYYSYHDKVTEEEYNNMLKNIDYSLLPEGIKFEFK